MPQEGFKSSTLIIYLRASSAEPASARARANRKSPGVAPHVRPDGANSGRLWLLSRS